MSRLKELVEREAVSDEMVTITRDELMETLNELRDRDLPEGLEDTYTSHIRSLASMLAYMRVVKALKGVSSKQSFDNALHEVIRRIIDVYSEVLSGDVPVTARMRVPVVMRDHPVVKLMGGLDRTSFTVPLEVAVVLRALGLCDIIK